MSNLVLLLLCLGAGLIFARLPAFPKEAHKGINAFLIWVSLPAISLLYIPKLEWSWAMLFPALMPWLILLLAIPFFVFLGKLFSWQRSTVGALILVGGLSNTSFVGFPLLEYLYESKDILRYAVLADQPGSFLAVSILGISIAATFASGKPNLPLILKKLVIFPPFIGFILALLITPFGGLPEILEGTMQRLGDTLSPLALFAVGLQIKFKREGLRKSALFWALSYKLFLAPLAIWVLYALVFGLKGVLLEVSVLEAGMASMVTAALVASEYDLDPNLANLQVAVSIPISLITVYAWWYFL
ncbi:AEC family transporter [Hugenholtzia roseola]|uniref:AEC family transporter n=1 Tax=Hugenholtzia roseola TaxID=1002 RepID=UPI00042A3948|nr:AEC family transporter [Hugenholtzia roseola]